MRNIALYTTCLLAFWFSASAQATPCLDANVLEKMRQNELNYLLNRVPPAFKHAVDDGKITLTMALAEGVACRAQATFNLPADDLAEGNKVLEADPAKRIILFSQGYALPDSTTVSAQFEVDSSTLAVSHQDILQTAELGKLRASIEMLYATLSQSRAVLAQNQTNSLAWPKEFRDNEIAQCSARAKATNVTEACTCKIDALAKVVSARQVEYQTYLRSNPYASATGAGNTFNALEQQVSQDCGLQLANAK